MAAVDEQHEQVLKNLLCLPPGPVLPDSVEEVYWLRKEMMDKQGAPFTPSDLATIAIECGAERKRHVPSFHDVLPRDLDTPILAKWRGEEVSGWFKGVRDQDIVVVLDDDTAEERLMRAAHVRLALE